MKEVQIPIYRAARIDNGEYIEIKLDEFFNGETMCIRAIDLSTLSISSPDMIDRNNKRIFASLSEDGKGGDIVYLAGRGNVVVSFSAQAVFYGYEDYQDITEDKGSLRATGIYEGEKR